MKKVLVFIALMFCSQHLLAEDRLLFQPLVGNVFEPRVGAFYQTGEEKLRLDIGASIDLAEFDLVNDEKMSIGADFFTYTRLRSVGRFKFPVETSDYFFGMNCAGTLKFLAENMMYRLRVSHISSHLVDGSASDGVFKARKPFTYSREFVDLTLTHRIFMDLRVYYGGLFIFSSSPDVESVYQPQLGLDYKKDLSADFAIVAGSDLKVQDFSDPKLSSSSQAGLMWKMKNGTGLLLSLYHYSGYSMHGMFYDQKDDYLGIGFQIYFY